MQMQANLLGMPVIRPTVPETTAFGAACLAGLGCGYWKNTVEIKLMLEDENVFRPQIREQERLDMMQRWKMAIRAACIYKP